MPELDFFYIREENSSVELRVFPKGVFRIQTQRTDFYFRDMLEGTMTFKGADFQYLFNSDKCTRFIIRCDFRGVEWTGTFTKTDCRIHASKKYIEVTPMPYDDYRNFLPYLQVPVNVLPPISHEGETFRPDTIVKGTRYYEKERRVVEITEPYDGPNAASWVGYSVNDWIGGTSVYGSGLETYNSLIYYLRDGIGTMHSFTDAENDFGAPITLGILSWLDLEGYNRRVLGLTIQDLFTKLKRPRENFTLSEVVNHYDKDGAWERCELIYEREVWRGDTVPQSSIIEPSTLTYDSLRGGWELTDSLYVRRPLEIIGYINQPSFPDLSGMTIIQRLEAIAAYVQEAGDGTWYSDLGEPKTTVGGHTRSQALYRNRYWENIHSDSWHTALYGVMDIKGRYHRLPVFISKFLANIANKGGDYFPIESEFLTDEISPITGFANEWASTMIVHNSDFKRPESTEKATKQEFTFKSFIDAFCALTNTGWALIDGKFRLEHTSWFDNGLTYTPDYLNDPTQYINPLSLENAAKSKGYLNLSNDYRYEQREMQKFEIFSMGGGEETAFHRSEIEYDSNCANNYPEENRLEYDISGLYLDPEWLLREGPDEGMMLVRGFLAADFYEYDTVQRVFRVDFQSYTAFEADRGRIIFGFNAPRIGSQAQWTFDMTDFGMDNFVDSLAGFVTANPTRTLNNGFQIGLRQVDATTIEFYGIPALNAPFESFDADAPQITQTVGSSLIQVRWCSPAGCFTSPRIPYVMGNLAYSVPDDFGFRIYNVLMTQDEFGRWGINRGFSLEHIILNYHTYRRSFTEGRINLLPNENQFISRPYIIQDLWFPYRVELEPYKRVMVYNEDPDLALFGIIRSAEFNCKDGVTEMSIGFQERGIASEIVDEMDEYYDDTPVFEFPEMPMPNWSLMFYVHRQDIPSNKWQINHNLGTRFFMRPIVWTFESTELVESDDDDDDGDFEDEAIVIPPEEIGYDALRVTSLGTAEISFSAPVAGEAYFLSLIEPIEEEDVDYDAPLYTHVQEIASDEWLINHNLGTEDIIFSVVLQDGITAGGARESHLIEVGYDDFEIVDADNVTVRFSIPVIGQISIATLDMDTTAADFDTDEYTLETARHILKPLVLRTGREIGYDYARLEDMLLRIGFTMPVIGRIIVKRHD